MVSNDSRAARTERLSGSRSAGAIARWKVAGRGTRRAAHHQAASRPAAPMRPCSPAPRHTATLLLAAALVGCGDPTAAPGPGPGAIHDLLYDAGGEPSTLRELHRLPAEGGAPVPALAAGTLARDPSPSPDGTRLVYVVIDGAGGNADLWIANRDGTGARQLTTSEEWEDQPAWSPDGAWIAYRSFAAQLDPDIFLVRPDGSETRNLTPDPRPAVFDDGAPAWSPDGARIAFRSNRGGTADLWTMRPDGTDLRRVTDSPDFDTDPAWSPDGARIAFRRQLETGGNDLAIVAAAGGEPTRLARPLDQRTPAWTPDGGRLVFAEQAGPGDRPELHSMRPDGSDVRRVTTDGAWGGGLNPTFVRRR